MMRLLWLALLVSTCLHAATGHAQSDADARFRNNVQLRLGVVASLAFHGEHTLGLEASVPWFRRIGSGHTWDGIGPVVQWQRLHRHDRAMIGLEYVMSNTFGVEAGWAYWETDRGRLQGLAVTPFFSLALVTIGPRVFLPLSEPRAAEVGINLYFKVRCVGKSPVRWYTF